MTPTTIVDIRDGDGITTDNPGEAFWWILGKRPAEGAYRSRDFALVADGVRQPLSPERLATASAYQFYMVRAGEEWYTE